MKQSFYTVLIVWFLSLAGQALAKDLVVYSGRSDKFVKPVVEAFTAQTGIKVVLHSGSSTALLNKLHLEAERTVADLYISNDAGNLQKGSELGVFSTLPADMLKPIPANYRAPDNSWVGLSARARVLVMNKNDSSADFVQSVFDLADPRLRDKLAITNSSNESFIAGVTVYQRSKGDAAVKKWLQGMKDNVGGSVFNKHGMIVKSVAEGKKAVGLVNHYYIFRHLAKEPDAPLRIVMPDQGKDGMGVAWNVAGAAVTKHAKHRDDAQKLMTFLISKQGQDLFARANSEYPTRSDVDAAPEVPAANSYKVADVPMSDLGKYRNATLDILEAVGMP